MQQNKIFITIVACEVALLPGGITAAADVGISISVNQPGLYGHIDIGNVAPSPATLVYPKPLIVVPASGRELTPLYLHVRPGHEKHWSHHFAEYDA